MKLEKAIEELTPLTDAETTVLTYSETEAAKLLIEAGKREKRYRFMHPVYNEGLLPGETEE